MFRDADDGGHGTGTTRSCRGCLGSPRRSKTSKLQNPDCHLIPRLVATFLRREKSDTLRSERRHSISLCCPRLHLRWLGYTGLRLTLQAGSVLVPGFLQSETCQRRLSTADRDSGVGSEMAGCCLASAAATHDVAARRVSRSVLNPAQFVRHVCILFVAIMMHSRTTLAAPASTTPRHRVARRAGQNIPSNKSSLTCYSFEERTVTAKVTRSIALVTECGPLPHSAKLQCNQVYEEYVRSHPEARNAYRWMKYTYQETVTRTVLKRIPGPPSFYQELYGNFHWIDWNSTLPLIRSPSSATYVRCEWKFILKTRDEFSDSAHLGPAARIHLFNKIWVHRSPNKAGCRRTDGRLTITAQNVTGSKRFVERERYCGRRQLPGEQVKHFWPDTSVVTMSFRSSLANAEIGPHGYFFSYHGDEKINGCAYDCEHSETQSYDFCRNASLPAFLKISVDQSRVRNYTVSELIEGFTHATRLRQQQSREYHCVQRYPIFQQLFRKGSVSDLIPASHAQKTSPS